VVVGGSLQSVLVEALVITVARLMAVAVCIRRRVGEDV
jgi:hypothetical protein